MYPENGATDVPPGTIELWVAFDRDMSKTGESFCGGGPAFPKFQGRSRWLSSRKIVATVKLEPDHEYHLSLNCPAAHNFCGADGTPLEPVAWTFSTAEKRSKVSKKKGGEAGGDQEKANAACLKELMKLLRDQYSYYDLRDVDWKALEKKHREKIVAAKSTRAWVKEAAEMLSAAKDMHLWLKYKDNVTPTYKRKISRNYDMDGIKKVLPGLRQLNECAYSAKTDDNIGYIMITTLSPKGDELDEVQKALTEYKQCKALIIDLRPNSGGSEPLGMPIAAWFVEGQKVYSKHVSRDPNAPGGFSDVTDRAIKGNDEPKRFDKPVAVLIGPGIMSSAESFVLMLKQGKNVRLVGQATYGSSGNPQPHKLQNGVEAFIPSWKDMLPDGACLENRGVKPDVEVKADAEKYKHGDPVIDRALSILRGEQQ